MDSDQGKLFIGGISWETTEEKLKDYFGAFGEVVEAVIMKDRNTGRARGFGFIVFRDPSVADMVVLEKHNIDGRMVEAKKAVPKEEQQNVNRSNNGNVSSMAPGTLSRTKKIFVGGLASTVTENDFRNYFGQFGTITDVVVMYDHGTQRPRGFGFITYDSEDAVDRVLQRTFHELNEKMVEVKRAVPKDSSMGPSRNNIGGVTAGTGRNGSYGPGYSHTFNSNPVPTYGMRMDGRYSPSPSSRSNYSPYGVMGYGNLGHYSGSISGMQNLSSYGGVSNAIYRNDGFGGTSTSNNAGYGSIGSGYGINNSIAYGNSLGRNVWSTGTTGFSGARGAGSASNLNSQNAVGTWGSSPSPTNASSALYGSRSHGSYRTEDGAFINSSSRYGGQNASSGNTIEGLGGNRWGSGSSALFGDIYGSSGYSDSTWRVTPADGLSSTRVGSRGYHSGVFDFDSANGNEEDLSSTDGGYSASGRQSFRGVPV